MGKRSPILYADLDIFGIFSRWAFIKSRGTFPGKTKFLRNINLKGGMLMAERKYMPCQEMYRMGEKKEFKFMGKIGDIYVAS